MNTCSYRSAARGAGAGAVRRCDMVLQSDYWLSPRSRIGGIPTSVSMESTWNKTANIERWSVERWSVLDGAFCLADICTKRKSRPASPHRTRVAGLNISVT